MSRQMYKIKQEIADIDRAALEVEWVGTLAVSFGSIPAGGRMKAFLPCFWSSAKEKWGPRPRVLLPNSFLWYRSPIVLEEASSQYVGVWARFVLFTSSLLFCRFSTLLTRYVRRKPVA